jgi:general secretion pathway protein A
MYLAHFGLHERPFSNTPDPGFVYLGARHEEALAHLLYGVQEHGGFVQLTGEIGTGKTTVCRLLLERLPEGVDVALILNPILSPEELLAALCDELGVKYEGGTRSRKVLVDILYRHLLAAHAARRRTVLIVDEAQNLTVEALEQLRLLTNLETSKQKLLQIILIGQPELVELLDRPDLRQLSQRITARYHLLPFTAQETRAYLSHRLALAGGAADIFEGGALREVHRLSGGVPRLINVIGDRALLGAYAQRRSTVDRQTVRAAAREVLGRRRASWRLVTAGALVLLAVGAVAALLGGAIPSFRPLPWRITARSADAARSASPTAAMPAATPSASRTSVQGPMPASLSELLRRDEPPADRASSFMSLFAWWRLEAHGWSGEPCEAAASMGLECVDAAGGWPTLRRLDLPAALRLLTPDGKPHWAAIVALDAEKATLVVGARVVTPPLKEIDAFWDGRFEVLWQPPPIGTREVVPGTRGKPVVWLRQRLDALDGQPSTAGGDVYDEQLSARVLAFQQRQSLATDGIAGLETLARLGSLVDQRIPSLSRAGR